jgi:ATP-dependent DNA helicase RecG
MDLNGLTAIIREGENERVDFKQKAFLNNSFKIAEQFVAFANRQGGTIVIGVTDRGEIEGETFDADQIQQTLTNISHDRCSPAVNCSMKHLTTPEGEVLLVMIDKRKGMPHAVVNRGAQHIRQRTYYIRQGNSNRLVTDQLLNYLFTHVDDPAVSLNFDLNIYYSRSNPRINPVPRHRAFRPVYEFISFLAALSDADVEYILADESSRLRRLYGELLPYSMLS